MMMTNCDKCKIRIDEGEYSRYAQITPLGYWTDIVKVGQSTDVKRGRVIWRDPEISWGGGGTDGTVSGNALIDNLIEALNHAKEIADEWRQRAASGQTNEDLNLGSRS